uniref:Cation-transporting ATPase n=1 Tax=Rhizophora mucronata TaxID=61149 RepID=A0A2P2M6D4_RHIMU
MTTAFKVVAKGFFCRVRKLPKYSIQIDKPLLSEIKVNFFSR